MTAERLDIQSFLNFLEASVDEILTGSRQETSQCLVCSSFSPGDKYHQYEFKHQPSHEECVHMSRSSPSVLFTSYTDIYCEDTLESLFTDLFGSSCKAHLCLCDFWCTHMCVSLIFLFLVQSAATEQAHVTPAGTGRASGSLSTLPWWDESTSVPSPHLLHRPGDGAVGGGGPRRREEGRVAMCSMTCSV